MKVGVNIPNYAGLGTREATVGLVLRSEELGYDSVWTTDHILMPADAPGPFSSILETFVTLSYVAGLTERVRLGTSIVVLPQRDPILVAKQAATLDHLSGGRLILGVGAGWVAAEYGFLGSDFQDRGKRLDEYIGVLRELWTSEDPRFDGETVSFGDAVFAPRPVGPAGIPILIGGNGPPAFRRAATIADGWHPINLTPEAVAAGRASIADLAGDRECPITLRISMTLGPPRPEPARRPGAAPPAVLQGGADEIAHQIAAYRDAGVTEIVLDPNTQDRAQFAEDLARFSEEVRPLVES